MANTTFTQLPNLSVGNITANTIIPVVSNDTNYTVTTANLQTYINGTANGIVTANLTITDNIYYTGNTAAADDNRVNPVTGNVSNASGYNLTFNIPAAGTWAINFTVTAGVEGNGIQTDSLTMGLFNGSNVQVGNSVQIIANYNTAISPGELWTSAGAQYIVTTAGAETFYANSVGTVNIVTGSSAFGTYVQLDPTVGQRTAAGYIEIYVDGNLRYLPFYS